MKKILALMLAAALALSLVACGGGSGEDGTTSAPTEDETLKATIVTNEGETVEMTAEELMEICDSNEARFNKLYQYAEIEFTGTVDYIKVGTSVLVEDGKITSDQQKIVFKEGWCLVLSKNNTKYDLADYGSDEVLHVVTSIYGSPYDTEYLQQTHDNNRVVWLVGNDKIFGQQHSSIETVIEKDDSVEKDYSELADEQNTPA